MTICENEHEKNLKHCFIHKKRLKYRFPDDIDQKILRSAILKSSLRQIDTSPKYTFFADQLDREPLIFTVGMVKFLLVIRWPSLNCRFDISFFLCFTSAVLYRRCQDFTNTSFILGKRTGSQR